MKVFITGSGAVACFAACYWFTTAPTFGALQFAGALVLLAGGLTLEAAMLAAMWRELRGGKT